VTQATRAHAIRVSFSETETENGAKKKTGNGPGGGWVSAFLAFIGICAFQSPNSQSADRLFRLLSRQSAGLFAIRPGMLAWHTAHNTQHIHNTEHRPQSTTGHGLLQRAAARSAGRRRAPVVGGIGVVTCNTNTQGSAPTKRVRAHNTWSSCACAMWMWI
jgi:hypothetical protein